MGPNDHPKHKLAAILYADVAGYSRLMGVDEHGTHEQLAVALDDIAERVRNADGRVVHYAGDAVLAEFASVVAAVETAIGIQHAMAEKSSDIPDDRRVQFRIGVNLGEVIVDRDDIYGEGVNVAARLEGLAQTGGVCISQAVYSAIGSKLDLTYQDLGPQKVKNIADPIHAFHILLNGEAPSKGPKTTHRRTATLVAAGLTVCLIAGFSYWFSMYRVDGTKNQQNTVSANQTEMPSIAVLPFQNLRGNVKEDYFSDGITQDIITDLSRFSNLFVIAANSVFVYKGKAVDVKDVGRELGVRYVLEGSVQKVGNKVRFNAQLIDATTNHHIWADRYDREITDIFVVQDEITKAIVSQLRVTLTEVERSRTARYYTDSLEAYDLFLRGRSYLRGSRQTHSKALTYFNKAIALDPKFAAAYAEKSMTYFSGFIMPMSRDQKVITGSLAAAQHAVALDPNLPLANARLGWALFANRRHEEAIVAGKRAVALGPNDAESHAQLGNILNWTGKPKQAIPYLEQAMRLNPHHPFYYRFYLGHSHYLLKNREQAIKLFEKVVTRAPYFLPVRRHLAVLYEEVGDGEKAKAQTKEILRIFPGASIEDERARCFYKWDPALQTRFFGGLRKSEMPEGVLGKDPVDM